MLKNISASIITLVTEKGMCTCMRESHHRCNMNTYCFSFQVLQAWNSYPFHLTPVGAHQVDFWSKTKDDPDWLVEIRRQEVEIIQKWVGWALRKLLSQGYNKYQHNLPSRFVSDTLLIYINQCSSLGQLKDQFNLIQSIHLIQTVPIFAWFDRIEL